MYLHSHLGHLVLCDPSLDLLQAHSFPALRSFTASPLPVQPGVPVPPAGACQRLLDLWVLCGAPGPSSRPTARRHSGTSCAACFQPQRASAWSPPTHWLSGALPPAFRWTVQHLIASNPLTFWSLAACLQPKRARASSISSSVGPLAFSRNTTSVNVNGRCCHVQPSVFSRSVPAPGRSCPL